MALTPLKREPVKYIRDFIKKEYRKADTCFICGASNDLELHHVYSLSQLWRDWLHEEDIEKVEWLEQITKLRVNFSKARREQLSNQHLYTLCKAHHSRLHTIYGQRYDNGLVSKIESWLKLQREKNGLVGSHTN